MIVPKAGTLAFGNLCHFWVPFLGQAARQGFEVFIKTKSNRIVNILATTRAGILLLFPWQTFWFDWLLAAALDTTRTDDPNLGGRTVCRTMRVFWFRDYLTVNVSPATNEPVDFPTFALYLANVKRFRILYCNFRTGVEGVTHNAIN